jgi:hypothetical protein
LDLQWIEDVLGRELPGPFNEVLKNGTVLCEVRV